MHKFLQKPSPGRWHSLARQLKKFTSRTALAGGLAMAGFLASPEARAQTIINNYVFAASSGTYTPLGASATQVSALHADGALSNPINIGFSFNFDGVNYTQFRASSDGYISFGTSTTTTFTNSLATTAAARRPLLAPLWDDLDGSAAAAGGASNASYELTGTPGSQVLTFEWRNWEWNYNSGEAVISFQVKLYEGSNKIEFIYQPEADAVNAGTASVGISGTGSGPGSFLSLSSLGTNPTASYTTETTTISAKPAAGQTYTFNRVTPATDVTVIGLTDLPTTGCFGQNQTIKFTVKNLGTGTADFSVTPLTITAAVTGTNATTFPSTVINTGTLASGASMDVTVSTTYNMSTAGTYTFNASATTLGEVQTANDALLTPATRTVSAIAAATPVALPQNVTFTGFTGSNLSTVFTGWTEATGSTVPSGTTSSWVNKSNLGSVGNITAKVNLLGSSKREWIISPKITPTATTALLFKAAVTTKDLLTAHATGGMAGTDDEVHVMVSTNCGVSYTPIYTINGSAGLTNILTNQFVSLSSYAGQDIYIAFMATEGTIDDAPDYDFHIDDVFIGTPTATVNLGATAFINPLTTGCYGTTENATVTIRNFGSAPIDFSVTNATVSVRTHGVGSGVISTTLNTGILAPGATQNVSVGTINMSPAGTYHLRAYTTITGDTDASSDTIRTSRITAPIEALPLPVTFAGFTGSNLTTVFPKWREATGSALPTGTTSAWTSSATNQTTLFGSTTAKLNFPTSTSTIREEWIVGPNVIATATTAIAFKAAITTSSGIATATMLPTDSVKVMVSTNCGASFTKVGAVSGSDNLSNSLTDFVFNLGSYAGQNIIIALVGKNGSARPTAAYDFILDDIFLGTPPPLDMGVTALVSPVASPVCYTATEPVIVTIKNYHAQPIDFATDTTIIRVNITGAITQTLNLELNSGTLASGATQNVTVGSINMTAPGTYTFNSVTVLKGDGNATNNAMPATSITNGIIATFPTLENFETATVSTNATGFVNGWTVTPANTTSAFRWNVEDGPTPSASSDTGPAVDHTTGTATGKYAFTETSSGATGDIATLVSPCIDLSGQTGIGMEFWYHMYGATIGTLSVDVFDGNAWINDAFTISGQQQTTTNEDWRRARVDLSAYSGNVIKVRFRALRGTSFTGDIAIDDVLFYVRSTVDVMPVALAGVPTIGCFSATQPVAVTIKNDGLAPIDFAVNPAIVTVNVTGAATQTLTDTLDTGILAIGATQNLTVGNLDMSAYGTYTFNATATAIGDLNTANATMKAETRVYVAPVALPQTTNFTGFTGSNLTTVFPNWYEATGATTPTAGNSTWLSSTGLGGTTNVTAKINLFGASKEDWIVGPKITATANTVFRFKAAITEYNALTPDPARMIGTDDRVEVMVSTDCGITFMPIYTLDASNTANLTNVLTEQHVSLGAYAGQNIIVAIRASEGVTNDVPDYDFHVDDLFITDLPAVDLSPIALAGPVVTTGCYGATQNVVVTLKNLGSAPINFATDSAVVTVDITGTGGTAQTLKFTVKTNALNGGTPLPVFSTIDVPVGVLNMSGFGTYIFNASISADGNTTNNTLAASTITVAAPVSGTATASTTSLCLSGTTTLNLTGQANGDLQWQSATSATGPFTNISGATAASFTSPTLTQTTYYRAVVSCGTNSDTTNVVTVTVTTAQVASVLGDTRCGSGTVNLTATPSAGATINWYSAATGGSPVATGNTYSPNVTATTTYYASAVAGATVHNAGLTSTNSSYGTWGDPGSVTWGLGFNFTEPGTLTQVYVYPASAGNVVVRLYTRAGVAVGNAVTVPVTTADVGNKTLIPLNIPVPAAGNYNLINVAGSVTLNRHNPYTGPAFPLVSASGVVTVQGGVASASSAPSSSTYYNFFDISYVTSCETARTPVVATVDPVPVANLGADVIQCNANPVTLDAGNAGATYEWSLDGTVIPGATSQTLSATTTGTYVVTVTNATNCSATDTVAVTFSTIPATPTVSAAGSTTICAGDSVILTGASTTPGVTYQWLLNGAEITGATSASVSALTAGNYAIVAYNASGCSDTSTVTAVTVNPKPATPTITQGGMGNRDLTSSAATGNQWLLNGTAIAGATAQTYTATANGNYAVVVTDNGCASDTSAVVNITNTGIKGNLAGMSVSVYPNPNNGQFNVKLMGYKHDAALELYSLTGQLIVKENVKVGQEVTAMQVKNLAAGTYLLKVVSEKGVQISKLIVE